MENGTGMAKISFEVIGEIRSCFSEKFGIPRQAGLVKTAVAYLVLHEKYSRREMIKGLTMYSHIWVQFFFHETAEEGWRSTVRPPRLGGQKRVGVFASRSPHRPNHIGLSAVRLEEASYDQGRLKLTLLGGDFLDRTPVFDIKPYLPYSDCIDSAEDGFSRLAQDSGTVLAKIFFSKEAENFCLHYLKQTGRDLKTLITELLSRDPRPASQRGKKTTFGMLLWDVNIIWEVREEGFVVQQCSIEKGG